MQPRAISRFPHGVNPIKYLKRFVKPQRNGFALHQVRKA
jgi:hypothetical protein